MGFAQLLDSFDLQHNPVVHQNIDPEGCLEMMAAYH